MRSPIEKAKLLRNHSEQWQTRRRKRLLFSSISPIQEKKPHHRLRLPHEERWENCSLSSRRKANETPLALLLSAPDQLRLRSQCKEFISMCIFNEPLNRPQLHYNEPNASGGIFYLLFSLPANEKSTIAHHSTRFSSRSPSPPTFALKSNQTQTFLCAPRFF